MTIKVVRLPATYRKAITREAWTGPWGSRRRRTPGFLHNLHMKVVRLSATCRKAITKEAWTGPWGSRRRWTPGFLNNLHMKVVRLSALGIGRLYPPGNIPGTHFRYRLCRSQGHSAAGRIVNEKFQSNPRPSGLQRSASTNYATACPVT